MQGSVTGLNPGHPKPIITPSPLQSGQATSLTGGCTSRQRRGRSRRGRKCPSRTTWEISAFDRSASPYGRVRANTGSGGSTPRGRDTAGISYLHRPLRQFGRNLLEGDLENFGQAPPQDPPRHLGETAALQQHHRTPMAVLLEVLDLEG